ncbi:MAG: HAD-IB family hydrolase [Gammaproteobacteria bacterium]|nr:HAD-IB family hydrolase [Gammaproteobacteria bacterium]
MALAIFDLDNTLIADDSDYLWGQFLVDKEVVDGEFYERENLRFYDEYKAGTLDIFEFLNFSLKPLAENTIEQLQIWRKEFFNQLIEPVLLPKAMNIVEQHKNSGDHVMIITATNSFVTRPIADAYGIETLIATEPEWDGSRYTGGVSGTPCFQMGKVERLNLWLDEQNQTMDGSYFYSDSHNDLPLLERVTHPVVVDADEKLTKIATERNWQQLSFR